MTNATRFIVSIVIGCEPLVESQGLLLDLTEDDMNLYFGPKDPQYGDRPGTVSVPLGRDKDRALTMPGNRDVGMAFHTRQGGYIPLTKEEAIEAAQLILKHYRVPFCNRVKGD